MITLTSPSEQLTKIYLEEEYWSKNKMSYDEAIKYHQDRLDSGNIYTYEEDGEVLGYYQREFRNNECFLMNLWVKKDYRQGKIFKYLYRHFFSTMPINIEYVIGEKQKLKGKWMKEKIKKCQYLMQK